MYPICICIQELDSHYHPYESATDIDSNRYSENTRPWAKNKDLKQQKFQICDLEDISTKRRDPQTVIVRIWDSEDILVRVAVISNMYAKLKLYSTK